MGAAFAPYLGHMPFLPFATAPSPPLEQLAAVMQANQVNQQQAVQLAQLQILMQNPLAMMQAMGMMQQQQQQQQQFPPSMFQATNPVNAAGSVHSSMMTKSASAPNLMQLSNSNNGSSSGNVMASANASGSAAGGGVEHLSGALQQQQQFGANMGVLFRPVPSRPSALAQGALAQQQQQGVAGFSSNPANNLNVPSMLGALNVQSQLGTSLKNVNSTPSLPSMIQ